MYNGKNPTAIQSREWLIQELLSMMNEMPYTKITIKEICHRADLSRQTFYNFFNSKEDMICFCLQNCYKEMMDDLSQNNNIQLNMIIKSMADTFYNHRELIQLIIAHHLDDLLEKEITHAIDLFVKQINVVSTYNVSEYGNAFLVGAISHTILYWMKDPCPLTISQLVELLDDIFSGSYFVLPK